MNQPPPTININPRYCYVGLVGEQTVPTLLGLLRSPFIDEAHEKAGDREYPGRVMLLYTGRTRAQMQQLAGVLPLDLENITVLKWEGRLQFVSTEVASSEIPPEVRQHGRDGMKVLPLGEGVALTVCLVPPYDVSAVREAILKELRELAHSEELDRVQIDFTGGTKMMSIGAFLAGDILQRRDSGAGAPRRWIAETRPRYVASEVGAYYTGEAPGAGRTWNKRDFPPRFEELGMLSMLSAHGFGLKRGGDIPPDS